MRSPQREFVFPVPNIVHFIIGSTKVEGAAAVEVVLVDVIINTIDSKFRLIPLVDVPHTVKCSALPVASHVLLNQFTISLVLRFCSQADVAWFPDFLRHFIWGSLLAWLVEDEWRILRTTVDTMANICLHGIRTKVDCIVTMMAIKSLLQDVVLDPTSLAKVK
jgi:hypothetical protein